METQPIIGPVKTRFAPSPTGAMHVGNFRVALFNYLFARRFQGTFLLRVEDTDIERSEIQFRDAILTDLTWAGLQWQEGPFYQSERQAIYNEQYAILEKHNLVYPCFCSEAQLALTRKVQLASNQAPRYPGTCRALTTAEIQAKEAQGMKPSLRFRVPQNQILEFQDLIKGKQRFETNHIGDFIIRRADKTAPFLFCNAVDDALMGVTHALRGDDHLANTPRQRLILEALKLTPPSYGHFPTILGPDGKPLSKRNGSRSIRELREEGFFPESLINYLARLGHYDPTLKMILLDVGDLSTHFDLANISHSPAHYDSHQLMDWQKEAMHTCSKQQCWESIAAFVDKWVSEDQRAAFVEAVQPNLALPKNAEFWAEAIFAHSLEYNDVQIVLQSVKPEFFIQAAESLKNPDIDYATLVKTLSDNTGLKGKAIFQPLRAALTGQLHGPELARVLSLMGPEKAQHRFLEAARYVTNL